MSEQYFADDPSSRSEQAEVVLTLPGRQLTLTTDHGVFSRGEIDAGTRYLLLDGPPPTGPVHRILDLGSGYGPIACALAVRFPDAEVWAIDVNQRARALCEANAARHHLHNVRVADPGGVDDDVRFDLLWSNPPIRIGKPALHHLLVTWLERLTPAGEAALVVQKHLGSDSLQRWLTEHGWPAERMGSRQGYRILRIGREPVR